MNTHPPQPSPWLRPAVGGGGRLPRKVLVWEGAVALALLILLVLAKHVISAREVGPNQLSALPGGRTISAGLDIGGTPTDDDAIALASSYRVTGLVNISGASISQQVTAGALHIGYLFVPIPSGRAPTLAQLRDLADFMQTQTGGGSFVYLNNDTGVGSDVITASMLLLLRGESWSSVQHEVTMPELESLSLTQTRAIMQLISALQSDGKPLPGNPYSGARTHPW